MEDVDDEKEDAEAAVVERVVGDGAVELGRVGDDSGCASRGAGDRCHCDEGADGGDVGGGRGGYSGLGDAPGA